MSDHADFALRLLGDTNATVSAMYEYARAQEVRAEAAEVERDDARGFCLAADSDAKAAEAEVARLMLGMEIAWGVIANANEGNWDGETEVWRDAAIRWRDEHWHPSLDRRAALAKEDTDD